MNLPRFKTFSNIRIRETPHSNQWSFVLLCSLCIYTYITHPILYKQDNESYYTNHSSCIQLLTSHVLSCLQQMSS